MAEFKKGLFTDGNGCECYEGERVHIVVLTEGGMYKATWDFVEDVHKSIAVYHVLIGLGLVKGIYKDIHKAREYATDATAGSIKQINKAFLKELGV